MMDLKFVPMISDRVFVGPGDFYSGGLATIKKVESDRHGTLWVAVTEHPGRLYRWDSLLQKQSALQNSFASCTAGFEKMWWQN